MPRPDWTVNKWMGTMHSEGGRWADEGMVHFKGQGVRATSGYNRSACDFMSGCAHRANGKDESMTCIKQKKDFGLTVKRFRQQWSWV